VAFLAAIDPYSLIKVDTACESITESAQQPLSIYDTMSARDVIKTTMPNYLLPQSGPSPVVNYKSAWESVVDWTINWTLKVVEGQELRLGRSYRLCVDRTGPGGYNGLQLSDVQEISQVYVAGMRSADEGVMVSNNTRIEVLCESTGDLYQLGCQTYSSFSPSTWEATENPGATSAYLAISCDTTDNDGLRDASNDNESASSYLMGDGNPYFYLEYDTRDMQLGVHYRLCEDLDGANTIASFNWPGIVVYLGGVTSMATVLRDPKDGPVVIAALGQGLLLNCLYGSCSTSTEAYLALNCDSSDNSTDRSEWASFTFRGSTDEWQWELQDWDLSNLTNGTTYKLCTDFDGKDQSPLESGFSGLRVPVTPITHISEESIQAATNQQVLLVCYGCMHIERYCDTVVGCPATDPIYIVSSAYLSNKDCNYSDYDGFQMEEGDWTTLSSPLRPTSNSTRASSLSASPGKESIVYNTEVILDSSAMVVGTRYRLCMDLDGSSSDFSFHDTGFSVYITPVSVVRQKVLMIGATTRLEFSCQGTGSVSSTCSTSSAVYLAQSCDLNRNTGVVATWEIHTSDASPSEAVTEIPGAEGSSYEFRVELNLTHLQVGWNYRLCIDTDTAGPLYFGDSGFAVDLSGVQGIYPSDTLQMSAATALDLYCPQYCVTSVTTAYLARESLGCDSSASDTFVANGEENTPAATLTTAMQPDSWQVASYFTRDFTVTFDTSALKAGESYVLCVDYDGPGSLTFANAYDGVVKMNPIVPESPALEASSTATLPLTCNACNLSTIIYLATACNVDAVISGNKEFCQVSWNLVPPQTCSNLLEANFPTNSGFVRLFPRTTLPGTDRWLAYLDTSGLTVGVVYRLCSDLDGGFTEQGFLDVGQVIITGIQKAQRSISTAATRHEWTGGSKQAFIFTCSSECTVGTTLVYLASMCDSSSDSNPLKTAVAGEQTAPVTIELLTSWTTELLPQRTVVLYGQDNSAEVFIFGGAGTKYIVMLDTSELTIGQFYKMCVDHDGTSGWFVGDTGLRVLATDLVVDVSIQRGSHEALSVNCTSGCSSLMAFLSVNCDEVTLGQVATAFANAAEGTLPNTLSRFSGPRLFSGQDTDNETVTDTPSIITGDTYTLYLDTSVLQLGQTYALCVDYDGYGSTAEVGDSGRRVYVTGVTQLLDEKIWKATNQVVQLRCNSGECSSNMRIYLSLSCDFTVLDGTASAVADVQTNSVALEIAGLEEEADDRGGLAASSPTTEVLEAAPLRQVSLTCSDCSTSSSVYLSISCDTAVLPQLTTTTGVQMELPGFTTASAPLWGTAPNFMATLDAGQLKPGALYFLCLDKDGTGTTHQFAAYGQVQISSPVPHRYQFTVDASGLSVGQHYKVCLDADGSGTTLAWGDTGLEVYISGVQRISPSVVTRDHHHVFNITCDVSVCSSTMATSSGGTGRSAAYLSKDACDRHIYDGILDSFDIDRVLPVSGRSVNVYSLSTTTFSSQFYGTATTKFNAETFFVALDTSDLLPGYHLSVCVDLDGQQVSKAFGPVGKVYISGVRGLSTAWINAAVSQRVELTCDADACGAKAAMAFLALRCSDFQTRHGGVSVGQVDELNHFSGQQLPLGEANAVSSDTNVSSADLILLPAAKGQSITFECQEECSSSSTAYLVLDGCDSSTSGSKVALFGKQTASVELTAHWDSSHFTAELDASPLTPGLHYNFCVDPDGASTDFTYGDTGVRIFVQGAFTPPMPFYGSLNNWYFDVDASHLAPGRRYKICTDFDGRLGPMEAGDTLFEVFVSPLQSLEYDSIPKSLAAQIGVSCSGCTASSDTTPPTFDVANSFPAHGSTASLYTNMIIAFSEEVQLGPSGLFQIWDQGSTVAPIFEVTAADIYAANAVAGGSLVRDKKIYITPATLCNVAASCQEFTNTRRYYVTFSAGTVLDLAGNDLGALDTSASWLWQALNIFSDTVAPEVGIASHVEVVSNIANGFIIFTEDVTFTGSSDLTLLDCGTDFDCTSTTTLTGGSKTTTLTPFVPGTTDLTTIRAQKQEFGMLEYHYELPNLSPRRYQLQVPVNYVSDTTTPTANTGPTSVYTITFDVGFPEGQQVLPVTIGTQMFLATDCNSTQTETYYWSYSPGQSSPVVMLQSNTGSHPFVATFNTNDLAAGVHYEVCMDLDGLGPIHRPGPTGQRLFISPVTSVSPVSVTQDLGRTVKVTCPTVCSSSTYMYLGIDCESVSRPGVVPETPPFRSRSAQLHATGVTGEWSLTFDAANLTAGLVYRLCIDVDGSSRTRYYGDSRLGVYISPVAGFRLPVMFGDSPAAVLSLACFARPQEIIGWWEENETEVDVTPVVENFTKNYVNQLHWCNELTSAYLGTSCDTSITDGYVAAVSTLQTQSGTLAGDTHLIAWPDISLLGENLRLKDTEYSELGFRYDAACAAAAMERGYVFWTRSVAENRCWFLKENAPAYAVDEVGYSSGPAQPQMWLLRLDTRPLLQGQYYVLCTDLDGYHSVSSMAETLLSVYISPVQAVSTTTIWKAKDQNVSLECANCTTATKLTLSVKCDGSLVLGEIVGQQSLVVNLEETGEDNMWFALVDAKTLSEGKHYRVCMELDETSSMGDTGFRVYVSPLYFVTPSVANQQFQELEVACPSALCNRATEVRLSPLHESCGNGNMDKVETTWVTVEGDIETKDLKPSRLRGGLDSSILTAGRGRGAYHFVVDTRVLEVDQNYRVCLDIDGVNGEEYQPGDSGYMVVKPDTTAPYVFGNNSNASEAGSSRRLEAEEEAVEEMSQDLQPPPVGLLNSER